MITVGLVRELYFISSFLKSEMTSTVSIGGRNLKLLINQQALLEVFYQDIKIWQETIDGPASLFGVESCDTIARIMTCIDNETDWKDHAWVEKLDFPTKID